MLLNKELLAPVFIGLLAFSVIPAKAGIQYQVHAGLAVATTELDTRLRGYDVLDQPNSAIKSTYCCIASSSGVPFSLAQALHLARATIS